MHLTHQKLAFDPSISKSAPPFFFLTTFLIHLRFCVRLFVAYSTETTTSCRCVSYCIQRLCFAFMFCICVCIYVLHLRLLRVCVLHSCFAFVFPPFAFVFFVLCLHLGTTFCVCIHVLHLCFAGTVCICICTCVVNAHT
jgi:hypothetical protein